MPALSNAETTSPAGRALRPLTNLLDADWLDFALSHVSPMLSVQRTKARVVALQHETPDVLSVELRPNHLFEGFEPGQAVPLRVMIGGVVHERYYSLTSTPGERTLRLGIKKQPGGVVSGYVHERMKVGDVVELGAAAGDFVLPSEVPSNLLLIAGGSGITPMISLLATALVQPTVARITLLYYARSTDDLAFHEHLRGLAARDPRFRLLAIPEAHATERHTGASRHVGRFSSEQLDDAIDGTAPDLVYLCGPGGLVGAVRAELDARGLTDRIRCEFFALPSAGAERDTDAAIEFRRSRVTTLSKKPSLLEAAEEAGLSPRSGCRIGICHTCTCTKVEGVVRDRITGAINDRPGVPIRLCVSEPLGPVVLDV